MNQDRRTAFLLCGPSLSGKTTAARTIAAARQAGLISADEINAERGLPFGGEGLPESVWAETLRVQVERLHAFSLAGKDVVIDDTLCYRWLRDRFRHECGAAGVNAALLVFPVAESELLRRHEVALSTCLRPVLSLDRLRQHLQSFQWPTADENATSISSATNVAALARSLSGSGAA